MTLLAELRSKVAIRFILAATCALALTGSAAACKTDDLTWHVNGTVSRGDKRLATRIQSVTAALVADGGVYLGGYEIDSANINHPRIAFVPSSLEGERYWGRPDTIQSFFVWNGRVNVLESSGRAFERHEDDWMPAAPQFKPQSVVVVATDILVACNPRPLLMTSKERGSCYAPIAGWSVPLNWQRVTPALCGGKLNTVEVLRGTIWARQLQPSDGAELAVRKLDVLPRDACSVKFNAAKR
jgi:hypothetical protein